MYLTKKKNLAINFNERNLLLENKILQTMSEAKSLDHRRASAQQEASIAYQKNCTVHYTLISPFCTKLVKDHYSTTTVLSSDIMLDKSSIRRCD